MTFYHKPSGEIIQGTKEFMVVCYPITVDSETGKWTYSGDDRVEYDDEAKPETNDAGETIFLTESGMEVPESEIEWRGEDEEDEGEG